MFTPMMLLALYLHPPTWAPPEIPPPLSDLSRLPSSAMCENQLAFFAARRAWLDGQRDLFRDPQYAPWFDAAIEDVELRRAPWRALHYARRSDPDEYETVVEWPGREAYARGQLAELRRLLGERDYLAGILPTAVGPEFWRRAD